MRFHYNEVVPQFDAAQFQDNILISGKNSPIIADYGLSRVMRMLDRYHIEPKTDISPTRWMPIEWIQLDSDDVREPTVSGDVWSFGMTMLVRRSPF